MKKESLQSNQIIYGNKGNVWANTCHIYQSGIGNLCGTPALATNWAKVEMVEEIGCPKCLLAFEKAQSINTQTTLDCTLDNFEDFMYYLKELNITFKVLTWKGLAGGNPTLEFYGSTKSISILTKDYTNDRIKINFKKNQDLWNKQPFLERLIFLMNELNLNQDEATVLAKLDLEEIDSVNRDTINIAITNQSKFIA